MGARPWRLLVSLLTACLWLSGAGCGSVLYVNQVTRKASASVAAAEAAEAQVYAPYHYTLAVEYLHKAREEAAAADYQAANRFGQLSYEAAERARDLAVDRAADPANTDWRPPPGTPGYDGTAPAPAVDEDAPGEDDLAESGAAEDEAMEGRAAEEERTEDRAVEEGARAGEAEESAGEGEGEEGSGDEGETPGEEGSGDEGETPGEEGPGDEGETPGEEGASAAEAGASAGEEAR